MFILASIDGSSAGLNLKEVVLAENPFGRDASDFKYDKCSSAEQNVSVALLLLHRFVETAHLNFILLTEAEVRCNIVLTADERHFHTLLPEEAQELYSKVDNK